KLGVEGSDTILKTVETNGIVYGKIGGIASMSVIIITLLAPLLGCLIFKKGINTILHYVLASVICIGSILLGIECPIMMQPFLWMIIVFIYVLLASGTPVWLILQPRDFINVQILYGGVLLMVVSIIVVGLGGTTVSM